MGGHPRLAVTAVPELPLLRAYGAYTEDGGF